jgi:hypothetical protein
VDRKTHRRASVYNFCSALKCSDRARTQARVVPRSRLERKLAARARARFGSSRSGIYLLHVRDSKFQGPSSRHLSCHSKQGAIMVSVSGWTIRTRRSARSAQHLCAAGTCAAVALACSGCSSGSGTPSASSTQSTPGIDLHALVASVQTQTGVVLNWFEDLRERAAGR